MNIQDKINEIKELKTKQEQQLQEATNKLIEEFEAFITDKTIPLIERWETFKKAPDELSNYVEVYPNCHYEIIGPGLDFFQEQLILNNIDNAYEKFYLKNIYGQYLNKDGTVNIKTVRRDLENDYYTDQQITELIILCTEEILQKNLVGFTCDA